MAKSIPGQRLTEYIRVSLAEKEVILRLRKERLKRYIDEQDGVYSKDKEVDVLLEIFKDKLL